MDRRNPLTDQLNAPLGRKKAKKQETRTGRPLWQDGGRFPVARVTALVVVLLLATVLLRTLLVDDPLGGRPVAEASVSLSETTNTLATEVLTPAPANDAPFVAQQPGGPAIITVDPSAADGLAGAPAVGVRALTEFGVLPDLVEETRNGPIPQVAADGRSPFASYARASLTPASAEGRPLIAIIVTGLGLNESATLSAIEQLPDNVTLAFAPYGRTLQRTTAAARAEGHELLLQVPLEPFDYPDNDPGPQTLLTGQPPRANLDRLFWLMARFGGYVGLINHMGARFTASPPDLEPLMEELGTRGLGYVDDGSSNRSLAAQMARRNLVPFARADIELDANPSRAAILEALGALEALATERGTAMGLVSALPVSVLTVSEWARGLEARNVILVPASALMNSN